VGSELNLEGSRLLLQVIAGVLTPAAACARLQPLGKPYRPGPCVRGANHTCVKHGQSLADCKEDGY
jgi:hypothetical protein